MQRKCSSWLCAFVSKLFKEQRCFSAKEDGCIAKPGTFIVLPGHMPAQWGQISNKIAFYRIKQPIPKLQIQVCFDKFKQVLQVVFVYFGMETVNSRGHFFFKWANSNGNFLRVNSRGHFWWILVDTFCPREFLFLGEFSWTYFWWILVDTFWWW